MGAQQSSSVINNLNERITNIALTSVQNCNAVIAQSTDQTVNIGGIFSSGASVSTTQVARLNIDCATNSSTLTNLQNQVIDAIAATNSATGVSVLPAFGNSTTDQRVNLTNIVKTSLSKRNIQNNYSTLSQEQSQKVSITTLFQFGTNVSATQDAATFAKAVLKSLEDTGVMTAVQNQVQLQGQAASANPLDFIAKTVSALFGGVSSLWGTILGGPASFIIMIIFIVGAISLLKSGALTKAGDALVKKAEQPKIGLPQPAAQRPLPPTPVPVKPVEVSS